MSFISTPAYFVVVLYWGRIYAGERRVMLKVTAHSMRREVRNAQVAFGREEDVAIINNPAKIESFAETPARLSARPQFPVIIRSCTVVQGRC